MHFHIKTYGCQMNEHDSRKIALLLESRGGVAVDEPKAADLILFNTCTIRDKAQHKAVSEIGRTAALKRERPGLLVGVCGCVAQQEKEALFARFPQIDLLFGPDQIAALPHLLETVRREHAQVAALDLVNIPADYRFVNLVPWGTTSPATAFVTIMKGCDSRCAYCIVPKVRGTEVSRPADEILAEITALAARGIREVTLLGQTVNSYGNKPQPGTIPFADLLHRIADETVVERIRFISPHPKDVDAALVAAYRDQPKLCPHIHLPLQSGADRVLRTMRRAYSRTQYLEKVAALRAVRPDIAISTDLIVGFPGETDADFAATLEMLRLVAFDGLYAFKYSPRPGTESFARLPDDVPEPVKDARLTQLLSAHRHLSRRKLRALVGTMQEVLVEGVSMGSGQPPAPSPQSPQYTGRTPHNRIVNFSGSDQPPAPSPQHPQLIGTIQPIRITQAFGYSLLGRSQCSRHLGHQRCCTGERVLGERVDLPGQPCEDVLWSAPC